MGAPPLYWSLIEPYWDRISIYDSPERFLREFGGAPEGVQVLFAAHWLQSEVRNGGFGQFFDNGTGVLAPEASVAFEALGMPNTAGFVRHVISGFGEPYPRDRYTRVDMLSELYDACDAGDASALSNPLCTYLDDDFFALLKAEGGGFLARAEAFAQNAKS